MEKQPTYHIRGASTIADDGMRMLHFFDSQLPWLATVGSGAQWGSEPVSVKEGAQTKYRNKVARSEAHWDDPFSRDWIRAYIAEVDVPVERLTAEVVALGVDNDDGTRRVPVAAMTLEGRSADYVRSYLPEQDDSDPFVFMAYLLTDRRTDAIGRKGVGSALISHAKDETQKLGLRRICSDCWRGNDRKLVK